MAGYTREDGIKTGIAHPGCYPSEILYDSSFGLHTPQNLLLSTGLRAIDHAVELLYHPFSTEYPCKKMAQQAIAELFTCLPKYKENPKDEDLIIRLYLGAFASLGFLGQNMKGSLGLSHTLGYALGSPYGIPHGITSCLTLGHVVKLKARASKDDAAQLAEVLPFLGQSRSGDDVKDAEKLGDAILDLVQRLGLKTTLTERGVAEDELDIITKRATGGQTEGKQYDAIKALVKSLY